MKTRKAIFVLFMLGCLAAFSAVGANAAASWVICTVDNVGPYGITEGTSGSRIFLTAVVTAGRWTGSKQCIISPKRGKEFLATALTAVTSAKKVTVWIDPVATLPTIEYMYINK